MAPTHGDRRQPGRRVGRASARPAVFARASRCMALESAARIFPSVYVGMTHPLYYALYASVRLLSFRMFEQNAH